MLAQSLFLTHMKCHVTSNATPILVYRPKLSYIYEKQHNECENIKRANKQVGLRTTYRLVKHSAASTYLKKEKES
jgi:hypothetical protein